jgi:hypothetical protein
MVIAGIGYSGHGRRHHRRRGRRLVGPARQVPFTYVPGPETVFEEADRTPDLPDENATPERPEVVIEAQGGTTPAPETPAETMTGLGDATGGLLSSRFVWFVAGLVAAAGARKMGWWK